MKLHMHYGRRYIKDILRYMYPDFMAISSSYDLLLMLHWRDIQDRDGMVRYCQAIAERLAGHCSCETLGSSVVFTKGEIRLTTSEYGMEMVTESYKDILAMLHIVTDNQFETVLFNGAPFLKKDLYAEVALEIAGTVR